jgi:acyl-CoA hydrolase|tara:strand:- start:90 stop:473 length:384 start_codon:yes stop_codon:yes gene_type:complete
MSKNLIIYNMQFRTRKLVKPEDLNAGGSLFGGQLLRWIDEEAAIYAMCQLDNQRVTTKFMSEIDFISPAKLGDVVEIGLDLVRLGRTSITIKCEARVKKTEKSIITIDKIVFVNLDEKFKPTPHNKG